MYFITTKVLYNDYKGFVEFLQTLCNIRLFGLYDT